MILALLSAIQVPHAIADGGGAYSVYDKNRDGYLDQEEFKTFAKTKHSRPEIADIWVFERVDVDGDNLISESEMVQALQEQLKRKKTR